MLDKKYFPKCIIALTVLSLILVFSVLLFPDSFFASEVQEDSGMVMGYEDTLFDTSQVLQIDISMEEDQWQDLLDNAISEEFYPCDVTVNGTLYENVGIRAKGNTSLSMVVSSDSDRYSFKLKFDEYVDGQMPQRGQMPPDGQEFPDAQIPEDGQVPQRGQMPENGQMPDRKDFGGKAPGEKGGGSGTNLNYIDDSPDSYSTIWDGEVFRTTDQDHQRVVTALKAICSEDADLETLRKYMDVDNMLKYMAVHTFVVNLDSLSGNMAHNYYLYEDDGILNLIPWDYNLAFGGFQGGSASETINFAIDTPFSSGISTEDRQFFMALLENETCLQQYHAYLRQLAENYVQNGRLETVVASIRSQIDQLAADDPTAFFTYEEYDAAAGLFFAD